MDEFNGLITPQEFSPRFGIGRIISDIKLSLVLSGLEKCDSPESTQISINTLNRIDIHQTIIQQTIREINLILLQGATRNNIPGSFTDAEKSSMKQICLSAIDKDQEELRTSLIEGHALYLIHAKIQMNQDATQETIAFLNEKIKSEKEKDFLTRLKTFIEKISQNIESPIPKQDR